MLAPEVPLLGRQRCMHVPVDVPRVPVFGRAPVDDDFAVEFGGVDTPHTDAAVVENDARPVVALVADAAGAADAAAAAETDGAGVGFEYDYRECAVDYAPDPPLQGEGSRGASAERH